MIAWHISQRQCLVPTKLLEMEDHSILHRPDLIIMLLIKSRKSSHNHHQVNIKWEVLLDLSRSSRIRLIFLVKEEKKWRKYILIKFLNIVTSMLQVLVDMMNKRLLVKRELSIQWQQDWDKLKCHMKEVKNYQDQDNMQPTTYVERASQTQFSKMQIISQLDMKQDSQFLQEKLMRWLPILINLKITWIKTSNQHSKRQLKLYSERTITQSSTNTLIQERRK